MSANTTLSTIAVLDGVKGYWATTDNNGNIDDGQWATPEEALENGQGQWAHFVEVDDED